MSLMCVHMNETIEYFAPGPNNICIWDIFLSANKLFFQTDFLSVVCRIRSTVSLNPMWKKN